MNVPDVTLKPDLQLNPYDVTLVVKDGKEFKAHRQVLSEASPFFEALLRSDMKEKKEGVIRLEIFNESQMVDILELIYTGNVEISTQENAKNLIAVADYLCLSNLKHIAGKFLEQNLTTLNCFSTLHLAEEYLCNNLMDSTRKFICSNFAVLAETKEFMKLPSHEVEKWFSSDEIAISGEEDVFETVLRWIDHDKSERSAKFSDMFRHVRLTFLSRDYLLSHVVTNDLVKDNKDCLNDVTEALAWIDRELIQTGWDVSRPHSPRKALEVSVIAVCGSEVPFRTLLFAPGENEFYSLPQRRILFFRKQFAFSCRGKLFIVPCEIDGAQCYVPELNRWTKAPWTKPYSCIKLLPDGYILKAVLVVENEICFVSVRENRPGIWLSKYDLDANSIVPTMHWLDKAGACYVAVNGLIYVIGGEPWERAGLDASVTRKHCALKFDARANKWHDIANIQEHRFDAFGVGTRDKIFIAGGFREDDLSDEWSWVKTCEVYSIETDEWHFIGSLASKHVGLGNMMLVDETLYALCGDDGIFGGSEWTIECYDPEKDEWKVKESWPVRLSFTYFSACSLRLFKGDLNNLMPASGWKLLLRDNWTKELYEVSSLKELHVR